MAICPSVCLPVCLSVCPSAAKLTHCLFSILDLVRRLSACLSVCLSTHLSVRPSVHSSVHLSVCPSVPVLLNSLTVCSLYWICTVRCLGGISGSMLLGMTRDELKTICPEEGGRVFYQLQNVKSALAANEVRPMI
ncbi:epidermal growth factor receptor kinase substrate 8 3 isoform X1 [Labeo rohita]|uniref:Epidermal growth factor receptor kinase substrate 8 3 isoform X1 n=1 Tax=Labeo rohita TaxID=84645 RepID=A0A498NVX9_LABRO|nr:epidermal growth factor receptor kinase substrate 8 3 isoform X1 [Labeo rohita]